MTTDLHLHLARMATARAHLAGAEAAELEAEVERIFQEGGTVTFFDEFRAKADAARRRYWRELAAAALLTGHLWEAAEWLGGAA